MIRRKLVLCLLCVAVVGMLAPSAFADATITIDSFYTASPQLDSDGNFEQKVTFEKWDALMLVCQYTVAPPEPDVNPKQRYKVVVKFRAFGQTTRVIERHRPGTYTTTISRLVPLTAAGKIKTLKARLKLRTPGVSGRDGLIDTASDTTDITVAP